VTTTSRDAGLLELLDAARRAPSAHNTQPWRFGLADAAIHLRADRIRALPVNDPHDRELTVSCGAALATIEVAAAGRGWRTATERLPDHGDPDLLAVVRSAEEGETAVTPTERALAAAIADRHTYRGRFAGDALPDGLASRLHEVADRAELALIGLDAPAEREDLAAAVAEADRAQFGDPRWRRELAVWTHPDRRGDGMPLPPGSALGTRLAPTAPGEPVDEVDPDRSLVLEAPAVVVLATAADRAEEWLAAGAALQRVLLTAAADGVMASYLNQACQVATARAGVRYLIGGRLHPQAILRLGVPARQVRRTDRRPLEELLEDV
jgi:nitroreductase